MDDLSEDEQDILLLGQYATTAALVSQDDTSFFVLCHHVAEKLEAEWPPVPPA